MIELPNGNIALSSNSRCDGYPIVIIDTNLYEIIALIQLEGNIKSGSSLCVFDNDSFIYVNKGILLQISCWDYSIIYESKDNSFNGCGGVIQVKNKHYFLIENDYDINITKFLCV